jgi:hypothetical protein
MKCVGNKTVHHKETVLTFFWLGCLMRLHCLTANLSLVRGFQLLGPALRQIDTLGTSITLYQPFTHRTHFHFVLSGWLCCMKLFCHSFTWFCKVWEYYHWLMFPFHGGVKLPDRPCMCVFKTIFYNVLFFSGENWNSASVLARMLLLATRSIKTLWLKLDLLLRTPT